MNQSNFYKTYNKTLIDISAQEIRVKTLKHELHMLKVKSAPSPVGSISFDMEAVAKRVIIPDMELFDRIYRTSSAIAIEETILDSQRKALLQIEEEIRVVATRTNDLEMRIFVACWLDGKKVEVVADEFGYALTYIYKKRSTINGYINDTRNENVM